MSFSPRETVASPGGCGKESCPFCEMSRQHAAGCARRLPKRIILVRHGESQGNLDMSAYSTTPDYRIPLTPRGVEQARAAGRGILDVVSSGGPDANWKLGEGGLSPEMITDQQWRASANRRSWSEECSSFIATFFDNWMDPPEEGEGDADRQEEDDGKIKSLE
ncbi:hypothetical protein TRIUR3_28745 [Triticum urartu]|uniref:Uncharacterized protein n=1 Tax=Triticum urartu TaxID=4572 RepID=M7ZQS0_TRIUA|nr:hypothetical protein TRIUR3_28745 [Triticum urartu]